MFSGLIVVLHVLTVICLASGIIGRDVCYSRAARTDNLATLRALATMGGVFERALVRPATFVVLLTGLIAAWTRGWPILGFLQGGGINWVLVALVIYLSTIPLIVFVFLPRGRVYRMALEEAIAEGRVTPALKAALEDPAVGAARVYEMAMIAALVWLMEMKPF